MKILEAMEEVVDGSGDDFVRMLVLAIDLNDVDTIKDILYDLDDYPKLKRAFAEHVFLELQDTLATVGTADEAIDTAEVLVRLKDVLCVN